MFIYILNVLHNKLFIKRSVYVEIWFLQMCQLNPRNSILLTFRFLSRIMLSYLTSYQFEWILSNFYLFEA
jgi:hypothetical protein